MCLFHSLSFFVCVLCLKAQRERYLLWNNLFEVVGERNCVSRLLNLSRVRLHRGFIVVHFVYWVVLLRW